jgi:hypothetical protein
MDLVKKFDVQIMMTVEITLVDVMQSTTLKVETVVSCKTMVTIYQSTQYHIPEDSNHHSEP